LDWAEPELVIDFDEKGVRRAPGHRRHDLNVRVTEKRRTTVAAPSPWTSTTGSTVVVCNMMRGRLRATTLSKHGNDRLLDESRVQMMESESCGVKIKELKGRK
jgi:hypothetical protein